MPAETTKTLVQDGFLWSRGDDRWLAKLAGEQYGVVGRGQLLELGLTEEGIEGRLGTGRLHRLYAGVYAVGHRRTSREGRWMAAVLASSLEAVLSHWSAAALWMIRPNSRSIIDITTPQKSRSWDGIRRHHKALPTDEITVEERIPVTTVPRTIHDLAASRLEERFAPFLRLHRLPQPRFNNWILLGGKHYQVDCHWPETGQIVELDGWEGHGTRTAFREDRARDRELRVAGYSVTRLTWNQLDDEPEMIASDLRALLKPNPLRASRGKHPKSPITAIYKCP
jgi:very-short-patch-repair endonuclease